MTPVPPISVALQMPCQLYTEQKRCLDGVNAQIMRKHWSNLLKIGLKHTNY